MSHKDAYGQRVNVMLYFFSYARADASRFLAKFYDDLTEAVRSKAGLTSAPSVSFRDAESIEPGKPWPEEIGKALQSCKVFVYLHTPTYFGRDGCGKEFEIIKRRLPTVPDALCDLSKSSCIQPVYWDGLKQPVNMPADIARLQLTHDSYGNIYNVDGMLHLIRTAYDSPDYWKVVNNIAARIYDAALNAPLQELDQVPTWDQIPSLFPLGHPEPRSRLIGPDRNGPLRPPRHARFVWVVGRKHELDPLRSTDGYDPDGIAEEWRLFLPDCTDPARLIAADAAREAKLTYVCEGFPDTKEQIRQLVTNASEQYTPIVFVVDLWTLKISTYTSVIRTFDSGVLDNCIVIVPWNLRDQETYTARDELYRIMSDVFPLQTLKTDSSIALTSAVDLGTFKAELARRLTKYVADVIRSLPAARSLPKQSAFSLPPQLTASLSISS